MPAPKPPKQQDAKAKANIKANLAYSGHKEWRTSQLVKDPAIFKKDWDKEKKESTNKKKAKKTVLSNP